MDRLLPGQIRAARAMLDWSMVDLAKAARVSVSTVKRFEDGHSAPALDSAVALLHDALATEGIRFLDDDGNGPGVRYKRAEEGGSAFDHLSSRALKKASVSVQVAVNASFSAVARPSG